MATFNEERAPSRAFGRWEFVSIVGNRGCCKETMWRAGCEGGPEPQQRWAVTSSSRASCKQFDDGKRIVSGVDAFYVGHARPTDHPESSFCPQGSPSSYPTSRQRYPEEIPSCLLLQSSSTMSRFPIPPVAPPAVHHRNNLPSCILHPFLTCNTPVSHNTHSVSSSNGPQPSNAVACPATGTHILGVVPQSSTIPHPGPRRALTEV